MPRSRYWPMTIGTPVRPRTASTIATLMDAMYSVPICPDSPGSTLRVISVLFTHAVAMTAPFFPSIASSAAI